MKKLFMVLYPDEVLRIGTLTSLVAFTFSSFSQTIVDSTGFYCYAGTLASAPAGWYMSWHSTSAPSYYTVATSVGIAPPSYKFGQDSVFVITPQFAQADTVTFWCKGFGISDSSKLNLYASSDSVSWTMFASRDTLPTSGTVLKYGIPYGAKWLLFVYRKITGNLAFDDVQIIDYPNIQIACLLSPIPVCLGDSACLTYCIVNSIYPIATWYWDLGDGNTDTVPYPCHIYANTGMYSASFTVYDINGDSASAVESVIVNPLPSAGFSDSITGNTVCFTDTVLSNPSLCVYSWNFGDGNTSSIPNPCHTYTANGTYTVCYTVITCAGCADTVCQTITITQVGINELNNFSSVRIFPTISANGIFNVQMNKSEDPPAAWAGVQMKIYNIYGECIYQRICTSTHQQIDLSKAPSGIYFVKVRTEKDEAVRKLILQK